MGRKAERMHCFPRKMSDVLDEAPVHARAVLKPWLEAARDAPSCEAGKTTAGSHSRGSRVTAPRP